MGCDKMGYKMKKKFSLRGMTVGVAALSGIVMFANVASAVTIWSDGFNRANSNTVGNGWSEIQNSGNDVRISSNSLLMRDSVSGLPDAAAASATIDTTGYENISVSFRWRSLTANESSDDLYLSWALDPSPAPTNEGAWTQAFHGGSGGTNWFSQTSALGLGAANTMLDLMFWTNVSDSSSGNHEGFKIDYVKVTGDLSVVPLPTAVPLFGAGLAIMGFVGWRKKRKAAEV